MNHPCSHVYIASCIVSFAHPRVSSEQHFGCVAIIVNVCGHISFVYRPRDHGARSLLLGASWHVASDCEVL